MNIIITVGERQTPVTVENAKLIKEQLDAALFTISRKYGKRSTDIVEKKCRKDVYELKEEEK